MSSKPVKIEIIQFEGRRFLRKTYRDGAREQTPIVKTPKQKRATARPYWYWELGTKRRRFF